MRLFVALDLPPELSRRMASLIDTLRPLAALRWSPEANLHITTRFIGEYPQPHLARLEEELSAARMDPFAVALRGLGFFPDERHAKTFYAGVDGGTPLTALFQSHNEALERAGVASETRPFRPHLTLARRKNENIGQLLSRIRSMSTDFGGFTAGDFHLYSSVQGPGGSIYTKLRSWSLS